MAHCEIAQTKLSRETSSSEMQLAICLNKIYSIDICACCVACILYACVRACMRFCEERCAKMRLPLYVYFSQM